MSLAGLGTHQAAVLSADGRIRTDVDGRFWKTVQTRSKVMGLNADDDQFAAVSTRASCPGLVVQRFDGSGNGLGAEGTCQSKVKVEDGATAAVSMRYQRLWLWSGDQVLSY